MKLTSHRADLYNAGAVAEFAVAAEHKSRRNLMSLEALGAELQKARENQRITLDAIAAETRISKQNVEDFFEPASR